MTGLVTTSFRVTNALGYKALPDDSSNSMYFFMGKITPWVDSEGNTNDSLPDIPENTTASFKNIWKEIIGMKKITSSDISLGVRRYDWGSGTTYDRYDDADSELNSKSWYVLTSANHVFCCLENGKVLSNGLYEGVPSLYEPSYSSASPTVNITQTPDGYVWMYIYTVSVNDFLKFGTSAWLPCPNTTTYNTRSGIYAIELESYGVGYTSDDCTITITGDGTGATATPVISGSQIVGITMTAFGSGYTEASVIIGGTNTEEASARAIIMPMGGMGKNPVYDLGARYAINSISFEYDEDGKLPVTNQYRQFGIIKNPLLASNETIATDIVYSMVYVLELDTNDTFTQDEIITVLDTECTVIEYSISGTVKTISLVGVSVDIIVGTTLLSGSKSASVTSVVSSPDLVSKSGDLLYLENMEPIYRNANQLEKFILINEF